MLSSPPFLTRNGSTLPNSTPPQCSSTCGEPLSSRGVRHQAAEKRWRITPVLIIDEVSLGSPTLFNKFHCVHRRFQTYTNVNAKYERSRLLAQVIGYNDGGYTVYFLFNGEIKKDLQDSDLSPYDGTYKTRTGMLGCEFFDEGDEKVSPGQFRVEEVMHKANEYQCIRLTGSKSEDIGKLSNYDIAAVIKAYETQKQEARGRGDVEVLSYRTRSRKL